MAKKGERKQQKRISVQRAIKTERKNKVWIVNAKAGPHSKGVSMALGFIVRDVLKLASNRKEAKAVLNTGAIKINGVVRKDSKFSVGLFDIIQITSAGRESFYRLGFDSKGRLMPKENPAAKEMVKICKVNDKRAVKGGKIQLTTDDGMVFLGLTDEANVNDSLKVKLPEKKVVEVIEMKKGNAAFIIGGKNAGKVAKIREISEGTINREKLITLELKGKKIMTTVSKLMVIGKAEPEMSLGVEA